MRSPTALGAWDAVGGRTSADGEGRVCAYQSGPAPSLKKPEKVYANGHQAMKSDLEIVVVLYNSWDGAGEQLAQMCTLARSLPSVHWSFVDNSERGRDGAMIETLTEGLANVRVSYMDNPGFAAACNAAVSMSEADAIMLLNPDVYVRLADLGDIVEAADAAVRERRTVAVSMVTSGKIHAGVEFLYGLWFVDASATSENVIGPSGGAGIYPRSVYVDLGGLWPDFFAWGEDADLALRLRKAGVPCTVLDLRLEHRGGHSVDSAAGIRFKVRLLYRNRMLVARRNCGDASFLRFALIYLCAVVLLTLRNRRRGALTASWRGFGEGLWMAARMRPLNGDQGAIA